jgi:hypothetical protein
VHPSVQKARATIARLQNCEATFERERTERERLYGVAREHRERAADYTRGLVYKDHWNPTEAEKLEARKEVIRRARARVAKPSPVDGEVYETTRTPVVAEPRSTMSDADSKAWNDWFQR